MKALLSSRAVWCEVAYLATLLIFWGEDKVLNMLLAVFGGFMFQMLAIWLVTERPSKAERELMERWYLNYMDNANNEDWN